jgi:hypothetical protein
MKTKIDQNKLLTPHHKNRLYNLVEEYQDVFGTSFSHVSQTNLLNFEVNTGNALPVYKRPFSGLSWKEKEALEFELKKMLKDGIILPARYGAGSGWSFPVRLITKKDGGKRLITDFRQLNKVTARDTYPMPNIQDLLDSLSGSTFFSTLDLLKGFHQIAVHENSIDKLTITTHLGNFSYTVMPFGVINGPSTFSRLINMVIAPLQRSTIAYIDDLTIHSASMDLHFADVKALFERLRECHLVLNSTKCKLVSNSIDFLGFKIVAGEGVSPLPEKVEMIVGFPRPVDPTGVRAFLGLTGFFRRHILLFAEMAAPITDLLKKQRVFDWTTTNEMAFTNLKQALMDAPTLLLPTPHGKFELYADASMLAIGGALTQDKKPVGFISRKLHDVEKRYPIMELELLALVYCLGKFRKYLVDHSFTVYTDNKALKYLLNKEQLTSRLARWVLLIQEFHFNIIHISGKNNVVADVMSRYPPKGQIIATNSYDEAESILYHGLLVTVADYEEELVKVYNHLNDPSQDSNNKVKAKARGFMLKNGVLYRRVGSKLLKVPRMDERLAILSTIHDGHGHFGTLATWIRLYSSYWWPQSQMDCKNFVRSCDSCQVFDSIPRPQPYRQVYVGTIFERFCIDYVGPFPETDSGNKFILLAVECFSRYPIAIATKSADATTAASFLYTHIFCHYGPPTELLSDNGKHFTSLILDNFLQIIKTKHVFTTPYRPNVNGMAEKINGVIVKSLKKTIYGLQQKNWDDYLNSILYAYRTKCHSSLRLSPFELMYGTTPNSMDKDLVHQIGNAYGFSRLQGIMDLRDVSYFKSLEGVDLLTSNKFDVGDQVLVLHEPSNQKNKLQPWFKTEIFTIFASYSNDVYRIIGDTGRVYPRRIHANKLRKYNQRTGL